MMRAPQDKRRRDLEASIYGTTGFGNNGVFVIPLPFARPIGRCALFCVASDQLGWEHVSVTFVQGKRKAIPTWEQMSLVKDTFWGADDVVVQYHPQKSEYVNLSPHTLHLWRPVGVDVPRPPSILVGPVTP
jgi:hypothetical protein